MPARIEPVSFIKINEKIAEIPLTRGYEAIVDLEDAEWLSQWAWYACGRVGYIRAATRQIIGRGIYMHDLFYPEKGEFEIDHRDRNPLNNRRDNLILTTRRGNLLNASPSINRMGICYNKRANLWMAYLDKPGDKRKYLGYRKTQEEALSLVERAECQ